MYYVLNLKKTKNEASKIVQLRDSNFGWTPKFSIGLHIDVINVPKILVNVNKRVYNEIFSKRL